RTVRNSAGAVISKRPLMSCSDVRHPIKPAGAQLLSVQPVDLSGTSPFTAGRSAGVVANSGFVYASAKRLYVATNAWGSAASTQIHAFNISDGKKASYV